MSRATACALAVAAALVVGVAPARATTVELREVRLPCIKAICESYAVMWVVAGAGEANDVTLAVDGRATLVTDGGAPLQAAGGCAMRDPATVTCPLATTVEVELGDRDDRLDCATATCSARGGPGDDVLLGGLGRDALDGGPGRDRLDGGAEADQLLGGPADDAPDAIDGGAGNDTIDYGGRTTPVRVDLGAGVAAEDRVAGVESVRGGAGDDVLVGDGGDNQLSGDGGADVLLGRDGHDLLYGGDGRDTLLGGDGDDVLAGGDGRDQFGCGAGAERVGVGCEEGVSPDCEAVLLGPVEVALWSVWSSGARFALLARCPWHTGGCRGRLGLRDARGRPLGARALALPAAETWTRVVVRRRTGRAGRPAVLTWDARAHHGARLLAAPLQDETVLGPPAAVLG